MDNYFFSTYGYEPSKGWIGREKQLNEKGIATDYHDEFGKGYLPGSATPSPTPSPSEHEYVDLGLPSGTLWATCNIGASTPEEAGLYFAWGETQGYTAQQVGTEKYFTGEGNHADYKYGAFSDGDETNYGMTKYNKTDGKTELDAEDDAATANWGSNWRMPTKEEFEELTTNTRYQLITANGVQGAKFISKVDGYTDKFLFFPGVGVAVNGEVINVGNGNYWSVSLNDEYVYYAWRFYFESRKRGMNDNPRYAGRSVRPVRV